MPKKNYRRIDRSVALRLLRYDRDTGLLYWRPRAASDFLSHANMVMWNKKFAGRVAGNLRSTGYVAIAIFNVQYLAHRVIWTMEHGDIPDGMDIDHRDGVRSNNRLRNFRLATCTTNGRNVGLNRKNTSGMSGVTWNKRDRAYRVRIRMDGREHRLGQYKDFDVAADVARKFYNENGFTARHGT